MVVFGNLREMSGKLQARFGNVRLDFGPILENVGKSSENGRKSSENRPKRRYVLWTFYIINRKLHGCLEILSSRVEKYFTRFLRSLVKHFSTLEDKFCISARPCNILYVFQAKINSLILFRFSDFNFFLFLCTIYKNYNINSITKIISIKKEIRNITIHNQNKMCSVTKVA